MIHTLNRSNNSCVSVGFIGVGEHARQILIPALSTVKSACLRVVTSRSLERAELYARQYGACYYTDSWQDAVDQALVSGIFAAGPPSLHVQVAQVCLDRGIPVFVEKPPALDSETLSRLVELEVKSSADVFVDYNMRFGATYLRSLEVLGGKEVIQCIKVRLISSRPTRLLWTCKNILESFLYAVGIHAIEMATNLCGNPRRVATDLCWLSDTIFTLNVSIGFDGGKKAILDLGNYSNRLEYSCELINTSSCVAKIVQHGEIQYTRSCSMNTNASEMIDEKQIAQYMWPSLHGGFACSGYSVAIESFISSIRMHKPSESPLVNSVPVFKVIDEVISQTQ